MEWLVGGFNLDVEDQLSFYGAYHTNPYNQILHVICVPLIWTTFIVWLAYLPKFHSSLPYWCNVSLVVYLMYAGFYAALDFETAMIVDAVYLVLFFLANKIVHDEKLAAKTKTGPNAKPAASGPSYKAAKWAFALHLLSWYIQIHPGHAVLEGRKPALLDSFVQSLTLAPLFVFYEVIWFFNPEYKAEMRHRVETRIEAQLAQMAL